MSSEITPLLRKRKKIVGSNAFYQQMVILLCCVFIISPTSANVKKENSINHKLDVIVDLPFETAFERKDINLLNWQHWPYSRYASHHPREFVTMATIHSDPETLALKEIKQDPFNLMALKISVGKEKEFQLLELLKSIQMKGFAVMHDGKLVFETYDQGMQKHDIQVLQSSSKTFTGMLIHKLAKDGLLDLEANVNEYLPDLGADVFKGSTLQNMLDMQIGYPDFGSWHKAGDYGYMSEIHMGLKPKVLGVEHRSILSFIQQFQKPTFAPGTQFLYNDMNTQVLALVAEQVTGKRYAQLIEETFWLPLQARHDGAIAIDDDGNSGASWGMAITLRDAARFGQMMLERGSYQGRRIIPESYFQSTFDEPITAPRPTYKLLGQVEDYRNHVWMLRDDNLIYTAGSFGQYIFADYNKQSVIVFMANWSNNSHSASNENYLRIIRAIGERISQKDIN
ncbi:serine hydrolase [Paraglaciecola chathamensis]|uniref:Serine hydrolase n=1 Tax=Paraglaciecola chathamensis TaxID=368405 RepID=A0ABS0WGP3_9ALTE|nr:serine hydrolase [Paraglaciecola chathamensis]MBJ2137618.1 serine hydrolase [Paraglaciecola chathamensis]